MKQDLDGYNSGNTRGMYAGINAATVPTPRKTAPLMSKTEEVITDQGKPVEHWVQHYMELYASQNVVTVAALIALPSIIVMKEFDTPPRL